MHSIDSGVLHTRNRWLSSTNPVILTPGKDPTSCEYLSECGEDPCSSSPIGLDALSSTCTQRTVTEISHHTMSSQAPMHRRILTDSTTRCGLLPRMVLRKVRSSTAGICFVHTGASRGWSLESERGYEDMHVSHG